MLKSQYLVIIADRRFRRCRVEQIGEHKACDERPLWKELKLELEVGSSGFSESCGPISESKVLIKGAHQMVLNQRAKED